MIAEPGFDAMTVAIGGEESGATTGSIAHHPCGGVSSAEAVYMELAVGLV